MLCWPVPITGRSVAYLDILRKLWRGHSYSCTGEQLAEWGDRGAPDAKTVAFPVLCIIGPKGTGKSVVADVQKRLMPPLMLGEYPQMVCA